MGVEGFGQLIKTRTNGECVYELPLENLRGKRVSIDTNWLMYKMMAPATKEIVSRVSLIDGTPDRTDIEQIAIHRIMDRIEVFLNHGITPVCVFDGYPHDIKRDGNPKKRIQKLKFREKYKQAKQNLYSKEGLLRNSALVDAFEKLYVQNVKVRHTFIDQVKDLLMGMGIPVLKAEDFPMISNDGEALCATLCMPGNDYCWASYTIDSDYHVYGGNLQILEIYEKDVLINNQRQRIWLAEIRELGKILDEFTYHAQQENPELPYFDFEMFQELCIFLGNDFNQNIPRKGPVAAWKAIIKYYNIQNMVNSKYIKASDRDEILKYRTSKEMFCSTQIKISPEKIDLDLALLQDSKSILDMANLGHHLESIQQSVSKFKETSEEIKISPIDNIDELISQAHLNNLNPEIQKIFISESEVEPNCEVGLLL